MTEDFKPFYALFLRIDELRRLVKFRQEMEISEEPFVIAKSLAALQDGNYVAITNPAVSELIHTETLRLSEELAELEGRLVRLRRAL